MANSPIFATASYDKIQEYINTGVLKYPSYVLCKDDAHKNTLIFINKDLELCPVKGYEQDSIIFVESLPVKDVRKNAFYVCNGVGYLYINGTFVSMFKDISSSDSVTSYDKLSDTPIVNKKGDYSSPVILSDLEDGVYSVTGEYKIGGNLETMFSSKNKLFIIESNEEAEKKITRFDGGEISVYTVNSEAETVKTLYATQEWVSSQGYTTQNYVDEAIDELYKKIAENALGNIVKVSQLENDAGYITADDINGIGSDKIASLF